MHLWINFNRSVFFISKLFYEMILILLKEKRVITILIILLFLK